MSVTLSLFEKKKMWFLVRTNLLSARLIALSFYSYFFQTISLYVKNTVIAYNYRIKKLQNQEVTI